MLTKSILAIPILALLWVTAIYSIVRFVFSRLAAMRERELRAAMDEVASVVRASIASEPREKRRVAAEPPAGEVEEEAEEAREAPAPRRAKRE